MFYIVMCKVALRIIIYHCIHCHFTVRVTYSIFHVFLCPHNLFLHISPCTKLIKYVKCIYDSGYIFLNDNNNNIGQCVIYRGVGWYQWIQNLQFWFQLTCYKYGYRLYPILTLCRSTEQPHFYCRQLLAYPLLIIRSPTKLFRNPPK